MSSADNAQPSSPARPRLWLREAGVYGMLYGIPLLILFPYTRWRPDAEFQSAVRTEAVSFTVGRYDKAGPFVGGQSRVDVTFDSLSKVELPSSQQWKPLDGKSAGGSADYLWGGTVRFRNVDLQGLLATAGTQVTILWYEASPDGVTMRLVYHGIPPAACGQVFLDEKSTVEFERSGFAESGESQSGSIHVVHEGRGVASIYPNANGRFSVSVTPCSAASGCVAAGTVGSVKPGLRPVAEPVKAIAQAPKPAGLPPENNVSLLPGSSISFLMDGHLESAILGGNNTVQVRNADRKETVLRGQRLEIGALKDRTPSYPSQISLQIKDGITVNVLGRAGVLRIDGDDARPSLAEYLRAKKVLSGWVTTSILLGSALLTVLSRIKLVKLDEMGG